MKKLLSIVLCLTMMASCVAFAAAEGTTTLTVAGWDTATAPYYEAVKTAYEAANPGVTIEWVDLASQEYNVKASTMLAGGDTTDIFFVKELSDMQNWAKEGFIVDMNDKIASTSYDMSKYAGMDTCYQLAGTTDYYALPFRADFWVLFYNKTLFDKASVEYPTNDMTWDAYKDLAIKMTGDGVYGTHYHTWLSAVANWAVCDGVNTLADGEYSDLKYFYQMVQDLEDAGACMTYDELKAANLHYSGAFAQGNIAMMPMGYWYASTLIGYIKDGTADFDWGITAVPHLDGVAAGSSFGSPTGLAVNAKSANADAAWDFVAWACGEEGAKAVAATGTRPAYVSEEVATVMAAADGFPTDDASMAALLPTAISLEWPVGDGVNDIKTIVNEEHSLIMTRELSIDEGVAEMEERAAEFIKK
ncbi:MAG: sugar ABC transporter substrate-binding protein [Eubacteriales bacterium]|nr:sugar ABC transporter substrate-binding protein [Eubacteriales bacterium]